jgi:hypothetical protein
MPKKISMAAVVIGGAAVAIVGSSYGWRHHRQPSARMGTVPVISQVAMKLPTAAHLKARENPPVKKEGKNVATVATSAKKNKQQAAEKWAKKVFSENTSTKKTSEGGTTQATTPAYHIYNVTSAPLMVGDNVPSYLAGEAIVAGQVDAAMFVCDPPVIEENVYSSAMASFVSEEEAQCAGIVKQQGKVTNLKVSVSYDVNDTQTVAFPWFYVTLSDDYTVGSQTAHFTVTDKVEMAETPSGPKAVHIHYGILQGH